MKKISNLFFSFFLVIAFTSTVHATQTVNARTLGLGGTGVAGGRYYDVLTNPAIGAFFENEEYEEDESYIGISGGISAGISTVDPERMYENMNLYHKAIKNKDWETMFDILDTDRLSQNTSYIHKGGVNAVIGVSIKDIIGISLIANTSMLEIGSTNLLKKIQDIIISPDGTSYRYHDREVLESRIPATNEPLPFDEKLSKLLAQVEIQRVGLSETGLNLAAKFGSFRVGFTPKAQFVLAQGGNFNLTQSTKYNFSNNDAVVNFNLDAGVQYTVGEIFHIGFAATNIISNSYWISSEFGSLDIKPQYTAGLAFSYSFFTFEINGDILPGWEISKGTEHYHEFGQFLRTGLEFVAIDNKFSVQLGYAYDISNNESDIASLGAIIEFGPVKTSTSLQYAIDGGVGLALSLSCAF